MCDDHRELLTSCRAVADNWQEHALDDPLHVTASILLLCANQLRDAIGDPRK